MAKIVESKGDDAKATARHAKIANEKKKAEEDAKNKIEDEHWKAKHAEEKRKEEIKKLPKDQQAAAKAELKEQIRKRKAAEKEHKAKMRQEAREAKEAERKAAMQERSDKAHAAVGEKRVEAGIKKSEIKEERDAGATEKIIEKAAKVTDDAPAEEAPAEAPAEEAPAETPAEEKPSERGHNIFHSPRRQCCRWGYFFYRNPIHPLVVTGSVSSEQRMRQAAEQDAETVVSGYDSRPEGHYNEEITTSRIKYGKNEVTNHNKHVVLKRLYHSFVNIFIICLAVIDVLWMVLDPDIFYFIILTTLILVSGTMTFIQETRSSKAASKLVSMVTTIITVRREGMESEIDSKELVVGDIIILDTGDMIPADVRIIQSNHLKVDQSALTGESMAATKFAEAKPVEGNILGCNNLAFMGTSVVSGSAEAVVVSVGDETVFGSMAETLSRNKGKTTYDKGSKAIVNVLLKLMFYTVPPVFIIMVAKGYLNGGDFFEYGLEALIFAITLAIGLMPEMLATIVSTNLAKGAIDMSKNKVIVKDVTAIQNFGAMDVLCSDKTGTLTENRITVDRCSDIYGNPSRKVELFSAINSWNLKSATNQIDWAIDEYAAEKGIEEERDAYEYVADVPFDFTRRRTTVVVRKDEHVNLMITKGAIPEILSVSSSYLDENGDIQPLTPQKVNEIMGLVEWYSIRGYRVLAVTHRYYPSEKTEYTEADEVDQIIAGMMVFTDPVKRSAEQAIKDLAEYGIAVKVLTGDNQYVSKNVCSQIGIPSDEFLTGPQIDAMSDEELREAVEKCSIFAQLDPDNKSRIVLALRANGHTVGLMGDGINDVVAMKNADVSISVDTGTDIAKETASMILLEKDLGILKTGAIEGRKVYVNSIKYVKMIGSINFGYMFSLIIATLLFNFEPIGALMILIFNLINDFACLIIPWDKVEDEFVKEPRKWDAVNLKNVMFHYGPMCPVTDLMTWAFMIFVVFSSMTMIDVVDGDGAVIFAAGTYDNVASLILSREDLSGTNVEAWFQGIWVIEQYWMQVWAIHIVRTNKLPFFQSWSCKALVVSAILALIVGTLLPFSGGLWEAISSFPQDLFASEFFGIAPLFMLWMPFIACVYFFGSHLVKKRMLRKYGYFAC